MTDVIKHYDSIGEFRKELESVTKHRAPSKWNGGETFREAMKSLMAGKLESVPKAEALLDKLADSSIELEQPVWEQSVAGYFPCVPAYLSGEPECMWRQVPTATDRSPIRVYASVGVSAHLDADELERRGVAILALCQKLQSIRPLELYVYADMGDPGVAYIPCVKVETSPLDLSTATYAMTHAGFLRMLCFGWCERFGWNGGWAWGKDPRQDETQRRLRDAFGMTDLDLLIPGGFSEDPLVRKPVEWINEQIARYTAALH